MIRAKISVIMLFSMLCVLSFNPVQGDETPSEGPHTRDVGATDYGPYGYSWYSDTITGIPSGNKKCIVYHPDDADATPPYPLIFGAPEFGGDETYYQTLGKTMASWGVVYIQVAFLMGNPAPSNYEVKEDPKKALDWAIAENGDPSSTLYQQIADGQYGMFGFSNGGWYIFSSSLDTRFTLSLGYAPALNTNILSTNDFFAMPDTHHYFIAHGTNDGVISAYGSAGTKDFLMGEGEFEQYNYDNMPGRYTYIMVQGGTHHPAYFFTARYAQAARYWLAHDESCLTYLLGDGLTGSSASGASFTGGIDIWDEAACNLHWDKDTPEVGETVSFNIDKTEISYLMAENTMTKLEFDFEGDGTYDWTSTSENEVSTTHEYSAGSSYYPKARITFQNVGENTIRTQESFGEKKLTVGGGALPSLDPPGIKIDGSFATSATVNEDDTLEFSGMVAPEITQVQFKWDWGDGDSTGYSDQQTASHTYTDNGVYTVTCNISVEGRYAESMATVTVNNPAPTVSVASGVAGIYSEGDEVKFDGSATDTVSDQATLTYRWDFGDGTKSHELNTAAISHWYEKSGKFTATLTVTDDDGESATDDVDITVTNNPPTGVLEVLAEEVFEERPVELQITPDDDPWDLANLTFTWDFGDGNTEGPTEKTVVNHTFPNNDEYTVIVTLHDGDDTGEITLDVAVMNLCPIVEIAGLEDSYNEGDTLMLDASGTTDVPEDNDDLFFEWDWNGDSYEGEYLEVVLEKAGTHDLTLYVSDDVDTVDTVLSVNVENLPPEADIAVSDQGPGSGDMVTFDGSGSTDTPGDQDSLTYEWDFGDGNTDSGLVVEHAFAEPGEYEVTLTVTDDDGDTHDATVTVDVSGGDSPDDDEPDDDDNGGSGDDTVDDDDDDDGYDANTDTDGDGFPDWWEDDQGYDADSAKSPSPEDIEDEKLIEKYLRQDSDNDGLYDWFEREKAVEDGVSPDSGVDASEGEKTVLLADQDKDVKSEIDRLEKLHDDDGTGGSSSDSSKLWMAASVAVVMAMVAIVAVAFMMRKKKRAAPTAGQPVQGTGPASQWPQGPNPQGTGQTAPRQDPATASQPAHTATQTSPRPPTMPSQ